MKRILSLFFSLIVIVLLCSCSFTNKIVPENAKGDFKVHFIDVGQGDCILLESKGDYVLIDAGETESVPTVCNYLSKNSVDSIDYVIATHPHSDHCGGLTEVIETFSCDNFITVETDQQTKTWINVLYAVDKNNVNYIDKNVGDTFTFGDASFEILGPYGNDYDNYNDYSVVVKATYQNNSFLFTGDCEKTAELEMIENGADLKADVLKVSHHGSESSSSITFLQEVSPTYAVIMCGMYNDYGHPHKETINSLNHMGITTYRTDTMGTIVAVSDGTDIEFFYENSDNVSKPTKGEAVELSYIGNKSSKKFHLSTCDGVINMNDKNKVTFSSREQAIESGYEACKSCNP